MPDVHYTRVDRAARAPVCGAPVDPDRPTTTTVYGLVSCEKCRKHVCVRLFSRTGPGQAFGFGPSPAAALADARHAWREANPRTYPGTIRVEARTDACSDIPQWGVVLRDTPLPTTRTATLKLVTSAYESHPVVPKPAERSRAEKPLLVDPPSLHPRLHARAVLSAFIAHPNPDDSARATARTALDILFPLPDAPDPRTTG